ncbi:SDR family oxidoreductase [Sinorhizobium mexicanum]|uniref:SDR family oxidoreductase n=1 Tax=Sinorhizobium mexicanum TaxID=375549 RepID=A0A859QVX2_9HYPH|nr:SDR family oxidoreductase [Sinorhizobium mexicanum]MBP1883769.1 NAD(P)-dependent dehydrogenase (short-subunit alcohol dehydrogenase family) [Sinorhizobium mexicanum]QLL62941.1 SDR family oxidoreductase [Sinorhizobium mexicanum]
MEIRLDGRTAVITGGSKGLGLAMAKRFAESGAEVAILARGKPALDEAVSSIRSGTKTRIEGFVCDVARPQDTTDAYERLMTAFGKIDILVNNAGQSRLSTFENITDEMWQEDIEQKLMGAIRMTRHVWPQMKERRWGRVINVLSINAKQQRAGGAPTTVTRAAGLALTKVLAGEGAPHNVLVNALMVGSIISDQIARRAKARNDGVTLEQMIADVGKEIPLGRMGTADEFANVACFLASEAASYVTGAALPVDGGKAAFI